MKDEARWIPTEAEIERLLIDTGTHRDELALVLGLHQARTISLLSTLRRRCKETLSIVLGMLSISPGSTS